MFQLLTQTVRQTTLFLFPIDLAADFNFVYNQTHSNYLSHQNKKRDVIKRWILLKKLLKNKITPLFAR